MKRGKVDTLTFSLPPIPFLKFGGKETAWLKVPTGIFIFPAFRTKKEGRVAWSGAIGPHQLECTRRSLDTISEVRHGVIYEVSFASLGVTLGIFFFDPSYLEDFCPLLLTCSLGSLKYFIVQFGFSLELGLMGISGLISFMLVLLFLLLENMYFILKMLLSAFCGKPTHKNVSHSQVCNCIFRIGLWGNLWVGLCRSFSLPVKWASCVVSS